MKTETYNGWTNYETWLVNVWMTNDQGEAEYWADIATDCFNDTDEDETLEDRKNEASQELAECLQGHYEDAMPETSGVFADLLNSAMSEVDWREIAEHLIEDVEIEVTE